MNRILIALTGLVLAAGGAFAAQDATPTSQGQPHATSYWLHPKLGMVKIDRATGFMVIARRTRQQAGAPAQPASTAPGSTS